MTTPRPTRTRVVQATEEHAELMAEFFRSVWDPNATADGVRSARKEDALKNPAAGGQPAPTFLVLAEERIVGYVTSIPGRVWVAGREVQAYWLKGLMVLPEYRNGPVGFLLLKEAVRVLEGYLFGMAVAPAARKLFHALKFADLGSVPQRLLPLNPAVIVRNLDLGALNITRLPRWAPGLVSGARRVGIDQVLAWLAATARSAYAWGMSRGSRSYQASDATSQWEEGEVDELWWGMRETITAGAVRNGAYVGWRYQGKEYEVLPARKDGELAALAVVKRPRQESDPRLRGIRVATLSDLIYDPARPGAGLAALIAAERAARDMDAHALLCGATGMPLVALLKRRGYIPIPGNVHLLVRTSTSDTAPCALKDWWITRGDGESDGF